MTDKGSTQRPKAVDDETFQSNWESTFGVKPQGNSADENEDMKQVVGGFTSGFTASRDGWPSFAGQPIPQAFKSYEDPWPFKTVEELAEAMNGQH